MNILYKHKAALAAAVLGFSCTAAAYLPGVSEAAGLSFW